MQFQSEVRFPAKRALIARWLSCGAMWLAVHSLSAANYFGGVTPASVPWTNGIVPYLFDTNYLISAAQKNVYLAGLREWELAANVKFIPRTSQTRYVLLQYTNDGSGASFYSSSPQPTLVVHGLSRGLISHEAGHLFGLQHEHQRNDSANYIVIHTNNVTASTVSQFTIDTSSVSFGAYDFQSVMHYGPTTFTNGLGDALDPLPAYQKYFKKIGNLALSIGDRAAAANLYGLPVTPLTNLVTNTADGGPGSLRAAIYYANDHPGTTISCNIATNDAGFSNGVFTIYLLGELPPLVSAGTIIDATTQPGFANNRPVIALDGSQVIPEAGNCSGLHLYGTNCVARALAFNNFNFSGVQFFCSDAVSNRVEGCYLGVKPDGTNAAPNNFGGIMFQFGPHDNFVGGLNATQRNLISGNTQYGIILNDTNTDRNVILGNYVGTDASGTTALANGYSGIGIWDGPRGTIIGGTNAGARNVISGNLQYGIYISDQNVSGTVIQGNYLGTDASGNNAVSNIIAGVGVFGGTHDNTIGGTTAGAGNVLSGNNSAGIYFADVGTRNNVVQGNYLGLNASGTATLANGQVGVFIYGGATGNTIGGTTTGAGNVLSGNLLEGVYITDLGTSNNFVQGNLIGTDSTGKLARGNGNAGVGIWTGASGNTIGGSGAGAGNVISGNTDYGVGIVSGSGNFVQGNFIGADITGTNALGNGFVGVGLFNDGSGFFSSGNNIGGTTTGAGNVISGNSQHGILISDQGTSGNFIQGNFIGTQINGSTALGNTNSGVAMWGGATNNLIGGITPGAGNVIAFNGWSAVDMWDANTTNNSIRGNSIFSNGSIGIDLGADGPTPNHIGFLSGPNDFQNFPIITNAFGAGTTTVVLGRLNSAANRSFFIDVYRTPNNTAGQGKFYAGSVSLNTDGSGNGSFALTNSAGNYAGQYFTATATITTGDTSEFSAAVLATNAAAAAALFTGQPWFTRANGFTATLTLTTNFGYRIQATTNLAGNPVPWVDLTNFTAINALFNFTDPAATNFPARFYRVISP